MNSYFKTGGWNALFASQLENLGMPLLGILLYLFNGLRGILLYGGIIVTCILV
jgi:hypothetical protein